ncbi:mini-chromosome maintenance replisome factor-domain-containing protein [Crucibulum laeve]|uniref:Mini-chromosome maintenance replisome factor-domain-containing protein n=1 Tax=Crucibulum laeve TaxID=68775 RepID=A0A5C3MG07_9AGAR|nr:mini-chromosome maintenance replisome factor-domain-containing protein [Crucibulum laeve]
MPGNAVDDTLRTLFTATSDLDTFPAAVSAHFAELYPDNEVLAQIPSLSPKNSLYSLPERSLVKFNAMVQDTSPSPEMYLATTPDNQLGGWGIAEEHLADIDYAHLRECSLLWAVSIPGESQWSSNHGPTISGAPTPSHPHKFPIPDVSHVGVQLKIYDTKAAENSVLDTDSPINVPTLHVLFFRQIPHTIVPRVFPSESLLPSSDGVRNELIAWIAEEALAEDREAAEWVLLAAIARVQSRTPPILPLSLTVSAFPSPPAEAPSSTPALCHVLSHLVPLFTTLPLSLNTLNNTSFAPESINENLHSGRLQLPAGSVCVVTESGVTEGIIGEKGLTNLRTVQEMMNGQTLQYIFPFSHFAFETDVSFVVLTDGKKSAFFQTHANVPLRPASPNESWKLDMYKPAEEIKLPTEETLELFRQLIGGAKTGKVSIGEAAASFIEEDFVQERKAVSSEAKKAEAAVTSDDLIHRMMVARLIALSLHEPEVSVEIWKRTKDLERKRKARVHVDASATPTPPTPIAPSTPMPST